MKTFSQFNESIRDKMIPKSDEDIRKSMGTLNPTQKLFWGSKHSLLWLIEEALEEGADIHDRNDLPLKLVITNKNIEMIEFLLKKGANIHVDDDYPIRIGVDYGDIEMIELLLKYGANPYANDSYAYQIAKENGRNDIIKLFNKYEKI